jgi:hypothetical protein
VREHTTRPSCRSATSDALFGESRVLHVGEASALDTSADDNTRGAAGVP